MPRASATSHSARGPEHPGRRRQRDGRGQVARPDDRGRPADQPGELAAGPREPKRERQRSPVAGPVGDVEPRGDEAGSEDRRDDQRRDVDAVDPGAPGGERIGGDEQGEEHEDVAGPVDDDGRQRARPGVPVRRLSQWARSRSPTRPGSTLFAPTPATTSPTKVACDDRAWRRAIHRHRAAPGSRRRRRARPPPAASGPSRASRRPARTSSQATPRVAT